MRKKSTHTILAILAVLLVSCEKETSWDFQSADKLIIADCILTNEFRYQELKLYYSTAVYNQQSEGISGALVSVGNGTRTVAFIEDSLAKGRYVSTYPFRATAGNDYSLYIEYNGIKDTAHAEMTAISPLEQTRIIASDSLYKLDYEESIRASMTEVYYNWSADTDYCIKYGFSSASEVYYSLKNINVSKEFAPEKLNILFPRNTQIIRRKYSLSDDHQQFISALLMETEWRGGLFDVEQGNVPTNFHQGIRGWFAACMVLSDTTNF